MGTRPGRHRGRRPGWRPAALDARLPPPGTLGLQGDASPSGLPGACAAEGAAGDSGHTAGPLLPGCPCHPLSPLQAGLQQHPALGGLKEANFLIKKKQQQQHKKLVRSYFDMILNLDQSLQRTLVSFTQIYPPKYYLSNILPLFYHVHSLYIHNRGTHTRFLYIYL